MLWFPVHIRSQAQAEEKIADVTRQFALNPSQTHALRASVRLRISFIQGSPGTGKTRTAAAAVAVHHMLDNATCVTAASHNGVDELAVLLVKHGVKISRVGRTDRIAKKHFAVLSPYSLQLMLTRALQQCSSSEKESYKNYIPYYIEQELENKVVCGTLAGIGSDVALENKTYTTSLVDEAGQITELDMLAVFSRALRIICVGDHQQLPPNSQHPFMHLSFLE